MVLIIWLMSVISIFRNIVAHVGLTLQHLLYQIELKLNVMQLGQTLISLHKYWYHVKKKTMDAMAVMHTMLTNGFMKITSLTRLVLFIKQEVGIMELVAVLCLSAEIANQEKLVTSLINTMFIELMNMVTSLVRKQWCKSFTNVVHLLVQLLCPNLLMIILVVFTMTQLAIYTQFMKLQLWAGVKKTELSSGM